jgi:hypothetical protein
MAVCRPCRRLCRVRSFQATAKGAADAVVCVCAGGGWGGQRLGERHHGQQAGHPGRRLLAGARVGAAVRLQPSPQFSPSPSAWRSLDGSRSRDLQRENNCARPTEPRTATQVRLAELGSTDAVWLVATMLDHLVKGEVMQATMTDAALLDFDKYLQKSFYKTGSLFAHSAKVCVRGDSRMRTAARG